MARDLALQLQCEGHIRRLRRTAVGSFSIEKAVSLQAFEENEGENTAALLEQYLLPVETVLDDIPALVVTESEAALLRNGRAVSLLQKVDLQRIADFNQGDTVLAKTRTKPVALAHYAAGEVKPFRVLNL